MFFAVIIFINTLPSADGTNWLKLAPASIGTGFANAHAILSLASSGGYLEKSRDLIELHDALGLVKIAGVAEAILGPIFLFPLLFTIQKRFRLA